MLKNKVFLSKNVNGKLTKLTEPVSFDVVTLGNTTLPAKDRKELAAFQKKVRELNRAVGAASQVLNDLRTRATHYRAALKSLAGPDAELFADIKSLEGKIQVLRNKLGGDRLYRRVDQDTVPGLASRIRGIMSDQRLSTSAPTKTHRNAYEIVADEFSPILEALKKIIDEDVASIEKKLEDVGAPYTPGRLPKWKKK